MDHPKKHHYVPVHLLKAFTMPAQPGQLWVLDSVRRERNTSSPKDCGCVKHFNRVAPDTHPDPMAIENAYAKIETKIAPIIKYTRNKASSRRFAQRQKQHGIPEQGKREPNGREYHLWSPEEYIAYLKCDNFSITTDNNWKMAVANEVMQSMIPFWLREHGQYISLMTMPTRSSSAMPVLD